MLRKMSLTLCILVCFIAMVLISSPAYGEETKTPMNEFLGKVDQYFAKKDYSNAADTLEKLLVLYPDTKDEVIYQRLGDLYDNYLFDFFKAVEVYKKYMQSFPSGRFFKNFEARTVHLEANKSDWDLMKKYRDTVYTSDSRTSNENIGLMEEILGWHPDAPLMSDIYNWLAKEYLRTELFNEALGYAEKLVSTFPGNGKPAVDKVNAYGLYADICMELHKYNKALEALKEVPSIDNYGEYMKYDEKVAKVKKERGFWYAYLASIAYIIIAAVLVLILRPWKDKDFKFMPVPLLKQVALLAVFTFVPMMILDKMGHGFSKVFPVLLVLSVIAALLIKLMQPVSYKAGRIIYILACFLLVFASVCISLYLTDSMSVVWKS